MKFGIWTEINGGVTGHRVAWVKFYSGRRAEFSNKRDAEEFADGLRKRHTAPTFSQTWEVRRIDDKE